MRNASKSEIGKFQQMLWLLLGKIENTVFVVVFHEQDNPELLRGYPYFPNMLLIFIIFRNKYGTAVMVGMYIKGSIQSWTERERKQNTETERETVKPPTTPTLPGSHSTSLT